MDQREPQSGRAKAAVSERRKPVSGTVAAPAKKAPAAPASALKKPAPAPILGTKPPAKQPVEKPSDSASKRLYGQAFRRDSETDKCFSTGSKGPPRISSLSPALPAVPQKPAAKISAKRPAIAPAEAHVEAPVAPPSRTTSTSQRSQPPTPAPAAASAPVIAPVKLGTSQSMLVKGLIALVLVLAAGDAAMWIKKHSSPARPTCAVPDAGGAADAATAPGPGAADPAIPVRAASGGAQFAKLALAPAHEHINLLLAENGAVASNCTNAGVLNDGNSTDYDGGNGFATQPITADPSPMLVTLNEPHEMDSVRVLLWDKDERTFRYTVSVSPDGKKWNVIQDNSKTESRSWQEIHFPRQLVKAVAVKGYGSTCNDQFHVVEIEGYDDGAPSTKLSPRSMPTGAIKAAAGMQPGIWAEFFDGLDRFPAAEDVPSLSRAQQSLAFGAATPAPPGQGHGLHGWPFCGACAAVFSGCIKIEKAGMHTFFVQAQDNARLYLDGELLIDKQGPRLQELWEQVDLGAGLHRLWVEYYYRSKGGATALNVSLKPKSDNKENISSKMLLYDPTEHAGSSAAQNARETPQPYAKFLGRDDKRGGAWRNAVGRDGYVIFNKNGAGEHLRQLPPYVAALTSSGDHCVWQVGNDARGLEDPAVAAGTGQRLCSCEYSASEVVIDVHTVRNTANRLSLYLLDFDPCNRLEKVSIYSGDALLHEMDAGDITKGTWLQWETVGPLTIHITNLSGPNAVAAGVFWDSDRGVHYRAAPKGAPTGELKPGLIGEYFDGTPTYPLEEDAPTLVRIEPTVAFGGTPAPAGDRVLNGWPLAGPCAALFHGVIKIPADGRYTFILESDDGSRLFVDGNKVADNDGTHPMKEVEGAADLKAGVHSLWVQYFNAGGQMGLNLWMRQKDGKKVAVPAEMLFHE